MKTHQVCGFRAAMSLRPPTVAWKILGGSRIQPSSPSAGGLSIEEICESVNLPKFTHLVGPEDVHRALDRLTKVALADGSVVALVATDGHGFWTSSGV